VNTHFENSDIGKLFPPPSDFVMRKVQIAQTAHTKLTKREKYYITGSTLLLTLIIVGMLVEFAVGFLFNDKLVSASLNEELTVVDQIVRAAASLASVAALMGVGFALHFVFKSGVSAPMRLTAFILAIALGLGIYYMAGSVGYQAFSTNFDRMWNGSAANTAPPVALDDSAPNATPVPSDVAATGTPFWLRLMASSALFVGVAFFVVILELAWLAIREKLANVREILAEAEMILGKYNRAQDIKMQAIKKEQDINLQSDPEYQQNHVNGQLIQGIQGWQKQIESLRSDTTNIGTLSPEEYKRRKENDIKIDAAIADTAALTADPEKIRQIVYGVFTKSAPPMPTPPASASV
jgi:hypothetical protein